METYDETPKKTYKTMPVVSVPATPNNPTHTFDLKLTSPHIITLYINHVSQR